MFHKKTPDGFWLAKLISYIDMAHHCLPERKSGVITVVQLYACSRPLAANKENN